MRQDFKPDGVQIFEQCYGPTQSNANFKHR